MKVNNNKLIVVQEHMNYCGSFFKGMFNVVCILVIVKTQIKIISIVQPRKMSRMVYSRHFPIWPT